MRDEVGELDDVAGVGIDERLIPHGFAVIPDLHDVCEGDGTILLRDKLDLSWVPGVRPAELAFSLGDRVGRRDGWGS